MADIPGTDTTAGEKTSGASASGVTIALQAANGSSGTVKGDLNSCPFIKCSCWRMRAGMVHEPMNRGVKNTSVSLVLW